MIIPVLGSKVISRFGETTSTATKTYDYYYDGRPPIVAFNLSGNSVIVRANDGGYGSGLDYCSGSYYFTPINSASVGGGVPSSEDIFLTSSNPSMTMKPVRSGRYQFRANVTCYDKAGNREFRSYMRSFTY